MTITPFIKRWFWLLVLVTTLIILMYFGFDKYLTFSSLREHRVLLLSWVVNHYVLSVLTFMGLYIIAVAVSFPGASYLTVIGGFLFGAVAATAYVVVSATIGSVLLFLAVRHAVNPLVSEKSDSLVNKMRRGFQENEARYLFFLRILPIFPFWAVNIGAAILNVRLLTFVVVTLLGIIPGAFVYALLGSGLGYFLDQNKAPSMAIIFQPYVIIPLILLAILAVLPIIYKKIKQKRSE